MSRGPRMVRYFELSSAYRDRNCYPCPAEFVVDGTCPNKTNYSTADFKDPVSDSYPIFSWYQLPYTNPKKEYRRTINNRKYASLWPLTTDPDNATDPEAGTLTALKFSGGTRKEPVLNNILTEPVNKFCAGTSNPVLNPYWTNVKNYFTGALLIRLVNPGNDLNTILDELNTGSYSTTTAQIESAVIKSYNNITGKVQLFGTFSENFDSNLDYFLIDFNTDPEDIESPRLFIPAGLPSQEAYFQLYLQNYSLAYSGSTSWEDSFVKIVKYDDFRRVAYLEKPLQLLDKPVGSSPSQLYGANSFVIRSKLPLNMSEFEKIGINHNSIYTIDIIEHGRNYKIGETIESKSTVEFYDSPGNINNYNKPHYTFQSNGYGFRGEITSVSNIGGILEIKIISQGAGFISGPIRLVPNNNGGNGEESLLEIGDVRQTIEFYNPENQDYRINDIAEGCQIFLPNFNQISQAGKQRTGIIAMTQASPSIGTYKYPNSSTKISPDTNYDSLLIRPGSYPPRILDCKKNIHQNTSSYLVMQSFRKDRTFNCMYKNNDFEETPNTPILVVYLENSIPTVNLGKTENGNDLYIPCENRTKDGYLNCEKVEVLETTRDNSVPIKYTGTQVGVDQAVCYEIMLHSVILPNLPLKNNIGGRIAFYPYYYVEFSNETNPNGGTKGILYSNNPNSNRAMFRVNIRDTNTPLRTAFIKGNGDFCAQTVKFAPDDKLYVRIYLQDGTLFETVRPDTAPPSPPDPLVQISVMFDCNRVL